MNQVNEQLDSAPLLEPVLPFATILTRLASAEQSSDFMYEVVLTFLAVLELARLRLLVVYQAIGRGQGDAGGQETEGGVLYISRPGMPS
jgi:hypothetical protein